ncbi:TPA: hypothetical protein NJ473_004385 [Vibrio parahaemolyticus]|nr:hypothetical protein [Vibrio parahaemolyticus]HCG7781489.1 hypothetical protein [Vibrio parahaemolyticus]HCH4904074.1 hypothetical protein [Vibrio parahaemolyticus]
MEHITDQLREPLNETTRKVRRNLLAASLVGLVTTKVGHIPTQITAFGIAFSTSNLEALMLLITAITVFYLVSFSIYIASELQGWSLLTKSKHLDLVFERATQAAPSVKKPYGEQAAGIQLDLMKRNKLTKPIFICRLVVEVLLPILISAYSITQTLSIDVVALYMP